MYKSTNEQINKNTITPERVEMMLAMQRATNAAVDPRWDISSYQWYRLVWVECGRMMEAARWDIYTDNVDTVAARPYLGALWSACLSSLMAQYPGRDDLAEVICQGLHKPAIGRVGSGAGLLIVLEMFLGYVLSTRLVPVPMFSALVFALGFSFSDLEVEFGAHIAPRLASGSEEAFHGLGEFH